MWNETCKNNNIEAFKYVSVYNIVGDNMKVDVKEVYADPVYGDFIRNYAKPGKARLVAILLKLYEEVYRHTTPKLDFKNALKTGLTKEPNWFEKYVIDEKTEKEILDSFFKDNKLTKSEVVAILEEYHLGSAPKRKE